MSRILFINSVCNGSTGTICKNLYKVAEEAGHKCCIAYGRGNAPEGFNTIKIGNQLDIYMHVLKARLFDASGFGSKHATKQFIKQINEFKPDIIHLHNIHGYYINIKILFNYLKKHPEIKKIWTLHDCWAFTGHCSHFEFDKCYKWKTQCFSCPKKRAYPFSLVDNSKQNYIKKQQYFNCVINLTLVTPSKWLSDLLNDSYLKDIPKTIIHNGIDLSIFKYTKSTILEEYHLQNKKVILGVASVWNEKKGLNLFFDLNNKISDDYIIVLIGLSKKQLKKIPKNIIGIEKTQSVLELVKWYSNSYVFLNLTLEDTYPTVNLEAIACGLPVITFNTGGSVESSHNKKNNLLKENTIDNVLNIIDQVEYEITTDDMVEIDMKMMNYRYLSLYKSEVA